MTKCNIYFLCVSLLLTDVFCLFFSTQNGPDGDVKDDLDSGDEADGKKIDTEEVLKTNALLTTNTTTMAHILLQDYHTDSRTSSSNLGSFDMKKPLGGLDIQAHPGMPNAHAFSQYSQMGMHAAKSHMMGGVGAPGGGMTPPTGGSAVSAHHASHRSPIFPDFFGKMMSISSCQTPSMLPSYYQNSMYSTEKIDSHLWLFSWSHFWFIPPTSVVICILHYPSEFCCGG